MIKTALVCLYISLHLAYIIYQNIQSHKEERTYLSLDKNLDAEFYRCTQELDRIRRSKKIKGNKILSF